jgi:hypothetical protein
MNVRESIEARRAYRSLEKVAKSDETVNDLALSAGLARRVSTNNRGGSYSSAT